MAILVISGTMQTPLNIRTYLGSGERDHVANWYTKVTVHEKLLI